MPSKLLLYGYLVILGSCGLLLLSFIAFLSVIITVFCSFPTTEPV
jgi:hypothetical protein